MLRFFVFLFGGPHFKGQAAREKEGWWRFFGGELFIGSKRGGGWWMNGWMSDSYSVCLFVFL
jgi:hypothetical protein